ncbi:MAG: phosphate ABC transporter substrate-binding protein [Desulfobacterales bacterium]|nr:phosphate ABC transporter substrate-binding protein [Desulfobacterales bacterium]
MNNLMTLWAEGFHKMYPNVMVEIEGKGSSTAPKALIAGTATFGPMSRAMKSSEQDDFEDAFGYKATNVRTSIDMLAVFVHKDNPIAERGLTLQQLDCIFSKTRKSGGEDIVTWGDLGLTGDWVDKPISLYGRNSASGTYGYYKKVALLGGDYKDSVKEQPGSSAVVQGIATDKYAIGYSGIGYKTADVRVLPLAKSADSPYFAPTADNAAEYPLARFLYLYVNYKPGSSLDPLRAEFLKYIFSKSGQSDVIKDGYIPVTATIAAEELGKFGIEIEE